MLRISQSISISTQDLQLPDEQASVITKAISCCSVLGRRVKQHFRAGSASLAAWRHCCMVSSFPKSCWAGFGLSIPHISAPAPGVLHAKQLPSDSAPSLPCGSIGFIIIIFFNIIVNKSPSSKVCGCYLSKIAGGRKYSTITHSKKPVQGKKYSCSLGYF